MLPGGGILLLNDVAYNANPDSLAAALRTLVAVNPPKPAGDGSGRRVAILGDMLELGESGPDAHRQIGTLIAEIDRQSRQAGTAGGIDLAIVIGRLAIFMAEALSRNWPVQRVHAFPLWDTSLPVKVAGLLQPGDAVLLKASRGMGLERLIPEIEKRFA